jgi:hypothetical protein
LVTVYIASPYTVGDTCVNVKRQLDTAHILIDKGFCPVVPLLSHYLHIHRPRDYEDWMKLDFEWLSRCDVVLRLPGESSGADREVQRARELEIPVVTSIGELLLRVSPEEEV